MINCAIHDYIEIACLYHYRIQLILLNSTIIQGRAKTTRTSADKEEFLVLQGDDGEQQIELESIKSMQALTTNPHFKQIDFL